MSIRFPASVYGGGDDPDPRFVLANERTFLAGIRTALALVAAGVALQVRALPLQDGLRTAASCALLALGAAAPVLAWSDWRAAERALRRGRALPPARALAPLAVGTTAAGVLVALGALLR